MLPVIVRADDRQMTPTWAREEMQQFESAGALANSLAGLSGPNSSLDEVRKALKAFQKKRSLTANLICSAANQLTRIETLATPVKGSGAACDPTFGRFLNRHLN